MRISDPRSRRWHRRRLSVEGLEGRGLLSGLAGALETARPITLGPHGSDLEAQVMKADPSPTTDVVNANIIQEFVPLLYGPNSGSPMTPTAHEIKRESFTAAWQGQYTVGAPRFSDRASTIHAYAVSGGSNQFLKGKLNLELFPPADPSATPTPGNPYANQVTGVAGLFPQDLLQSGSTVILDLAATPGPGSDPNALPTHLTWTYDANASAGGYAAPRNSPRGPGHSRSNGRPTPTPAPGQWAPERSPSSSRD